MKTIQCRCNLCDYTLEGRWNRLIDGVSLRIDLPLNSDSTLFETSLHPDSEQHLCGRCLRGLKVLLDQHSVADILQSSTFR